MTERPPLTIAPPYMFATVGIYMVNGYVQRVEIPTQSYSSNATEAFGPMWVRADLLPGKVLAEIFNQPVTYWPKDEGDGGKG